MPACKKQVYARMCEDENGNRTGKYRSTRYESRPKRGRTVKVRRKRVCL